MHFTFLKPFICRVLAKLVPFVAVVSADIMRIKEIRNEIDMYNFEKRSLDKSKKADALANDQIILCILILTSMLTIPPLVLLI